MAPTGRDSPPLSLTFLGRKDLKGSPRAYDPPSSHRLSVASTGVGDPHSPFFRSPEVTYRPSGPFTPRPAGAARDKLSALPPAGASPEKVPRADAPPRAFRKVAGPPLEAQKGTLMSPDIIFAKEHGHALPPLREVCVDMLNEGITRTSSSTNARYPDAWRPGLSVGLGSFVLGCDATVVWRDPAATGSTSLQHSTAVP